MHPDLVDSIISAQISPDALLERFGQGQAELNKNHYQASSDHFTAAIDEATNSLSTLLLSRALAYANDGQHDHALADAYKVIEITPASADGYLCTGDIHIVTDNREKALRIYLAKWDDFDLAPQVLEHLVLSLKCRNLEALSVGNCGVKTTQWVIRLLRMNIKTMKSLALIKVAQQLYPVIHQVLDLCPGITKLAFDLHESWDGESKARNIDYNAPKVIPPSSTWKPRAPLALEQLKLTSSILRHRRSTNYPSTTAIENFNASWYQTCSKHF
ncbi:hypothetical protein K492DRAFT_233776 [Lichtheimia hyalospora FSU 10163]|nr:hypothetical protein K492DRAFT_233776 [Lichtheimia hyalospora FSU 10163]